jgi:hypothetical protein
MHFDKQQEVVELIKKLAKKYNISYTRTEEALNSRFWIAREEMKKSSIMDQEFISVRLYKFGIFYIPLALQNNVRRTILKRKGEEENGTNLKTNQDAESK